MTEAAAFPPGGNPNADRGPGAAPSPHAPSAPRLLKRKGNSVALRERKALTIGAEFQAEGQPASYVNLPLTWEMPRTHTENPWNLRSARRFRVNKKGSKACARSFGTAR